MVRILVDAGLKTVASCQGGPKHGSMCPYVVLENPGNEASIRLQTAKALIEAGVEGFTICEDYMYQRDWAKPWEKAIIRVEFWGREAA